MFNFDKYFLNFFSGNLDFNFAFNFASTLFNPIPFLIVFVLTLYLIKKYSSDSKDFIKFILAIFLTVILTYILKYIFNIERPNGVNVFSPSFPSAHSSVATSYFIFLLHIMRRDKNVFRRYLHFAFCLSSALFVGVSRLYFSFHFLSDVLFGYILGGLCVYVVLKFYK